jgi:hypothetical protein
LLIKESSKEKLRREKGRRECEDRNRDDSDEATSKRVLEATRS